MSRKRKVHLLKESKEVRERLAREMRTLEIRFSSFPLLLLAALRIALTRKLQAYIYVLRVRGEMEPR